MFYFCLHLHCEICRADIILCCRTRLYGSAFSITDILYMANIYRYPTYIVCLMAMICTMLPVHASDTSPSYSFLNIPASSQVYGLGGINISNISDDINSIDQNPALMGPEFEKQLGISYMRYVGSSNFAGVTYGNGINDRSAWAMGIRYFGYGSMRETDAAGNELGTFSPMDFLVSGTYSHDITDRWRGGITLKMIYSGYADYTAFAVATDLGVNYYDAEKDLSFSITVANLGGQLKRFTDRYERLPIDLRVGWSQSFGTMPIRFSINAWNLTKWHLPYYETGDGSTDTEPELKDSFSSNLFRHLIFSANYVPSEKFYIGLGYNYKSRTDMSTYSRSILSGFSLGAGIRIKAFGVGVALAQPHKGATTFMVNFTTNFNDLIY